MIYLGQFADINNNIYTVNITTNGDTTQTEAITLGGSPFTTEMDTSSKTIYLPAKYQSASIQIITENYNFDIFSGKALGTKVDLLDSNSNIVWTGYIEPNLYDMGFTEARETIELNAIDALSSLQYIKYKSEKKPVSSILSILRYIFSQCNAYSKFYISNNTQLTKDGTDSIIDKLYLSEGNFFSERDDGDTDDDVAWTCLEALEEICRYIGVTVIADGDCVYMLDYDAIKAGKNSYYEYTVSGTDTGTLVTKEFSKTIVGTDYSDGDSKLSLDNVYNKVSVKDSFNKFDSILPDMMLDAENITGTSDANMNCMKLDNLHVRSAAKIISANDDRMEQSIVETYFNNNKSLFYYTGIKYYKSPYYKCSINNDSFVQSLGLTTTGSILTKSCSKELKDLDEDDNKYWAASIKDSDTSSLKNSIVFYNQYYISDSNGNRIDNPNKITNANLAANPILTVDLSSFLSKVIGGSQMYLLITGTIFALDLLRYVSKISNYPDRDATYPAGQYHLIGKLHWGDIWWDGEKSEWTTNERWFRLQYVDLTATGDDITLGKALCKDKDILNNEAYPLGTGSKGYLIPMPKDRVLTGNPSFEIHIYDPTDTDGTEQGMVFVSIDDLEMKAIVCDPTNSEFASKDTIYTNVLDNTNAKDLDSITFKVCTYDNKKPNYSSVLYKDTYSHYLFVDKLFNNVCYTGENTWYGNDGISAENGLRLEEHLIYKLYNQYNSPSIKLNLNLHNDNKIYGLYKDTALGSDYSFILDSINIDYKMNTLEINLILKK